MVMQEQLVCAICGSDVKPEKSGEFWKFWCPQCNRTVLAKSVLREA